MFRLNEMKENIKAIKLKIVRTKVLNASEYDQEIPLSQTADQPMAP